MGLGHGGFLAETGPLDFASPTPSLEEESKQQLSEQSRQPWLDCLEGTMVMGAGSFFRRFRCERIISVCLHETEGRIHFFPSLVGQEFFSPSGSLQCLFCFVFFSSFGCVLRHAKSVQNMFS